MVSIRIYWEGVAGYIGRYLLNIFARTMRIYSGDMREYIRLLFLNTIKQIKYRGAFLFLILCCLLVCYEQPVRNRL